jgi:hypothetical protein
MPPTASRWSRDATGVERRGDAIDAQRREPVMLRTSSIQPHLRPAYSDDAPVRAQELSHQQGDWEERRWLKWPRRNVDD